MDCARYYELIGTFTYAAVAGVDLAVAERSDFVYPFVWVVREDAIGGEDDGFRARLFSNAAWCNFRGLAGVRAEERARQVRCSVC